MPIAFTITPSSVEVTLLTRSAKILFRLLPGRHEMRKGVKSPGALEMRNDQNAEFEKPRHHRRATNLEFVTMDDVG